MSKLGQYKIQISDDCQRRLEEQRLALGFHSSNQLAAIAVDAASKVPVEKVWEVLAVLERYQKAPTARGRYRV